MITQTNKPLLGRCGSCDFALHAQDDQAQPAERYRDMEAVGVPYAMGTQFYARCPNRHMPFKLYRMEGTVTDFQCDARCENAKGHVCECSCGGMNHGKAYAITPTEIHTAGAPPSPDRPREPQEQPSEGVVRRVPVSGPPRREKVLLDVPEGEGFQTCGKVIAKKDTNDSTLYVIAVILDDASECIVKSFVPSYAASENPPEVGDFIEFKAKVKKHDDNEQYGPSTMVTYLEVLN